jgi:membrane-bound ClpP family serine protease
MSPFFLLFIGLLMIFLEFYTPGGILAAAGAIFIVIALVTFLMGATSPLSAIGFILLTIGGIVGTIWFALRRIKRSKENTLYLSKDQEGYTSTSFDSSLIGKSAHTLTDFGPSGYILVEGKKLAATCRDTYLEKGQEVIIIGGEGSQLIVKPKV